METPNQSLAYGVMGGRGDGDLCEGGSCKVKEQRKPLWWGSGMRGAGGGGAKGQKPQLGESGIGWWGVFRSTERIRSQGSGEEGPSGMALGCGLGTGAWG